MSELLPTSAKPASAEPASLAELTVKAVAAGIVLGVVFGAANAYLGLRVGMTVSASIPAAVMTVAVFRMLRVRGTILEANLSQTIGSASTSLATGTIFTIPALFLWGMAPPYWQVVALCFLGGVLGLSAMIPLRRMLIVEAHDELPYPEGKACAEVLRATVEVPAETSGASASRAAGATSRWIFRGMAVGALVKLALGLLFLFPGELSAAVPFLPKGEIGVEIAPALFGVGFILGYRQAAVCVAGAVISALVLTPLIAWFGAQAAAQMPPGAAEAATGSLAAIAQMDAGTIWSRYVRYIGAGAVATAGVVSLLRNLPSMIGAFRAVASGLRGSAARAGDASATPPTDRDLPGWFVISGIALVVLAAGFIPGIFAGDMALSHRLVCAAGVGVFGLLFVTVAARIVGIVGVTSQPTSGITLVTLLGTASIFVALGWVNPGARAAVLTVGTIVAIAASKAGDISQDLKTGFLVGATPWRQQFGQLLGAAVACWAIAATVLLLGATYSFGSKEIPAPQATLMKTIIEGVLAGKLPWDLVLTGGGLSLGAMLCGVSGLAFSIGVYLPLSSMAPIFLGGCVRALAERGRPPSGEGDPGVLAASGLVAGEGLAGVLVAGLVASGLAAKSLAPRLPGGVGELVGLAVVLAVGAFLFRAARSARPAPSA